MYTAVEAGTTLVDTQKQSMENKKAELLDAMTTLKDLTSHMREVHRQLGKATI